MSDDTRTYGKDEHISHDILPAIAQAYEVEHEPLLTSESLIAGSRLGFTPEQCEAILLNLEAQTYLSHLLTDYALQTGRALPFGLHGIIQAEQASSAPRWNSCLIGRIGCGDATWTNENWRAIIRSLPEEIRDGFDWDSYPAFAERPLDTQPMFALAAGEGIQKASRWDPARWEQTWRTGSFRIGARLSDDKVEFGLYSASRDGHFDLTLVWSTGTVTVVSARANSGRTVTHPVLLEAPGGHLPGSVTIRVPR